LRGTAASADGDSFRGTAASHSTETSPEATDSTLHSTLRTNTLKLTNTRTRLLTLSAVLSRAAERERERESLKVGDRAIEIAVRDESGVEVCETSVEDETERKRLLSATRVEVVAANSSCL